MHRRLDSPKVEDWYPSALSLVITLFSVLLLSRAKFHSWRDVIVSGCAALLPSALNISAIAIGFLATSQSILLSLSNTETIQKLKAGPHYVRLLRFLSRAISISFIWALLSAWLSTFHFGKGGLWRYGALSVWFFAGCCSIFCYYRASTLLTSILMLDSEKKAKDSIPEWRPE
jgi:hypothetical protein